MTRILKFVERDDVGPDEVDRLIASFDFDKLRSALAADGAVYAASKRQEKESFKRNTTALLEFGHAGPSELEQRVRTLDQELEANIQRYWPLQLVSWLDSLPGIAVVAVGDSPFDRIVQWMMPMITESEYVSRIAKTALESLSGNVPEILEVPPFTIDDRTGLLEMRCRECDKLYGRASFSTHPWSKHFFVDSRCGGQEGRTLNCPHGHTIIKVTDGYSD